MIFIYIYMFLLIIAPQEWVPFVKGFPTDFILFPSWTIYVALRARTKPFSLMQADKYLIGWILWLIISAIINGSVTAAIPLTGPVLVFYLKITWLYFLIILTIDDISQLQSAILFFLVLATILGVESIQHKLSGVGWAGQSLGWIDPSVIESGGSGRTKWVGIFDGPGVFCVIFTISLPFILQRTSQYYSYFLRVLNLCLVILMGVAIYFNSSRGGFLTSLAIIIMHYGKNIKASKIQLAFGLFLVVVVFLGAPSYLTTMHDSQKSGYNRVDMWAEGLEMVQQNPIFGIGKGKFHEYTSKLIAHNSAIEIMGETGLPGFFFWVALAYMNLKNLTQYISIANDVRNKLFTTALFISVIGYIISSMFVTLEYETFYMLLALCSSVGRCSPNRAETTKEDIRNIIILCVAFIVIMKVFVFLFLDRYS